MYIASGFMQPESTFLPPLIPTLHNSLKFVGLREGELVVFGFLFWGVNSGSTHKPKEIFSLGCVTETLPHILGDVTVCFLFSWGCCKETFNSTK